MNRFLCSLAVLFALLVGSAYPQQWINEENQKKLRKLGVQVGFGYGIAVTLFGIGQRDHNTSDMVRACAHLKTIDETVRGGTVLIDREQIESLERMKETRLGCALLEGK